MYGVELPALPGCDSSGRQPVDQHERRGLVQLDVLLLRVSRSRKSGHGIGQQHEQATVSGSDAQSLRCAEIGSVHFCRRLCRDKGCSAGTGVDRDVE